MAEKQNEWPLAVLIPAGIIAAVIVGLGVGLGAVWLLLVYFRT